MVSKILFWLCGQKVPRMQWSSEKSAALYPNPTLSFLSADITVSLRGHMCFSNKEKQNKTKQKNIYK